MSSINDMSKEQLLASLLGKIHGYYKAILEITEIEHHKFEADRPLDEIQPLLRKKQILLEVLADINQAVEPLKQYWREESDRTDPASPAVEAVLASIEGTVAQIMVLDTESNERMKRKLLQLREVSRKAVGIQG